LFLLLVSSSLNLLSDIPFPFSKYSTGFTSQVFRLSPLIWLGFCNHCNLACFRWSINFEHSSWNHDLLCFSLWYPRFSLTDVLMPSLIIYQASLISKFSSKLSKAANLFDISVCYFSLNLCLMQLFHIKCF
jgi:hypothetical protein